MKNYIISSLASLLIVSCGQNEKQMKPEETEVWTPVPKIVSPDSSATLNIRGPSDAIILFDGKDLGEWESVKSPGTPAGWTVEGGAFTVNKGTGNIQTKKSFLDYQLHLEWKVPANITGSGQARGNSGLFLAATGKSDEGYELQILDSYNNTTYVNGQTGSIYKQFPPLVNACLPPGEWQTYDIIWTAPRFKDGSLESPARLTVFHNGVLIQNNASLLGPTLYIGKPSYNKPHGACPIQLQAHGDESEPLSFRNIWLREL